MKNLFNFKCALAASIAMLPVTAFADEVTLKSADGTVNLVGEFVEFADDNYIIRTALGDLRISASRVRCEGAACPDLGGGEASFTIAGAQTIGLGMMPLLMTGYAGNMSGDAELTNTGALEFIATLIGDDGFGDEIGSFRVASSSSDAAFQSLLEGTADVGMSLRRIEPSEARALRNAGKGNMVSPGQEHILAIDSVVIITHPSNPVEEITMEQLRGIYGGEITNWSQLGGNDAPIMKYALDDDISTHDYFIDVVFDGRHDLADEANNFDDFPTDQEIAAAVNADPNAIGYVGFAFQRGAKPLNLVNACGLPTTPDEFSAKTEEYELNRRLYFYTTENAAPEIVDFMNYIGSSDADGIIAKAGFIDQGIVTRDQDASSDRAIQLVNNVADAYEAGAAREMLKDMLDTERLSATFRFRTGSSKLDEKANRDLARLVAYLQEQPAGTVIKVVGFTDDVGVFDANRRLSVNRATQVLKEIQAIASGSLNGIEFQTAGYGELSPSACNFSENGRSINRRVEVWMDRAG